MTKPKEKYISTSKMDSKLKAKWVKALRSRKFKQVIGCLEEIGVDNKYVGNCCLGVLCRVTDTKATTREFLSEVAFGSKNATGTLNAGLLRKFGLSPKDQDKLVAMNDGDQIDDNYRKYGFKSIATFIEKNIATKKKPKKAAVA